MVNLQQIAFFVSNFAVGHGAFCRLIHNLLSSLHVTALNRCHVCVVALTGGPLNFLLDILIRFLYNVISRADVRCLRLPMGRNAARRFRLCQQEAVPLLASGVLMEACSSIGVARLLFYANIHGLVQMCEACIPEKHGKNMVNKTPCI